ncbi:uncharacterized protein Z519_12316 [Cladophialophora bantiana CBS 173.52]|uniref:Uncharacterized protein n=1 Tax=Cladophialophora bantiana (strain ATCC 10958 / CBS 173.52 / CDC B-1940 / NIH 8579) TaxID=1442370 RepID=A0A0D2HRM7_CLAB1|nr:uncharacterized protein Z519_12316 [Cladophialophora bantiana CBS 173.52]KIW87019.1 hypothetical protein Z519_12316 [Cladophialophora bantiana CBS 173.52]
MALLSFETQKTENRGASCGPPLYTQGYGQAAKGNPQSSLSGAQNRTATAQNGLVTTHIKWRDAQVSKRK